MGPSPRRRTTGHQIRPVVVRPSDQRPLAMKTITRTRTGMTDWSLERERRPQRYFGGKQKQLANRLR